jgi:tRNA pseudouridine38-40 synthase
MARYQIILAYNGAGFFGSQRQASSRTVQGVLENSLRKLGWDGSSALMAGRTDTGVHATGQVASFDLDWQHSDDDLLRSLNANLPADVAVREVRKASLNFHPRFDATSRCYRYRLYCQTVRDPLREDYAWRIRQALAGDLLQVVAPLFIGQHDFVAYGTPPRTGSRTVRKVMKSEWRQSEDEWYYEVQGNAFLYRMVRRMVFVQVAVAQGKISLDDVTQSLAGQVNPQQGSELPAGLAPAHGLTLVEVTY